MTIQELELRTGLERATIRYYEREGLINPSRKENGYRDYTEADTNELLKIKLLRQFEIPIDTIKQLQQGHVSISDVLRVQSLTLETKIHEINRTAQICKEISNASITYQTLNAPHYLDQLKSEPGAEQQDSADSRKDYYPEYHPVRRLIARFADYTLLYALTRFLLIVILRIRPYGDWISHLVSYGVPFLAVPVLAWMEHVWATTPGKWLMGIRLEYYRSGPLRFSDALTREWDALRFGYGFGIPFWRLWRMYKSYKDYKNSEKLLQDQSIEHIYSHWDLFWNTGRIAIFAAFCAVIIAINCFSFLDIMKPKHRTNDLTIAEFAENFNYYSDILYDSTAEMESDGTWPEPLHNGNVVAIGGTVERQNAPYDYTLEGERITKISYHNAWTNFLTWTPFPKHIIVACLTAVASQPGMSYSDLREVAQLLDDNMHLDSGNIQYENITIQWDIETYECYYAGKHYLPNASAKEPKVTMHFDIIID